jgi:hypothetical protein
MQTDKLSNIRRQNCRAKGSGKRRKIQESMDTENPNVEPEILDYTSVYYGHLKSNKYLRKHLEAIAGKHSVDETQKTATLNIHYT